MRISDWSSDVCSSDLYPRNDHETACWACLCLDVATLLPASDKAAYIGAMTAPATGPVATEITARLTQALTPTRLEVITNSAGHRGHAGDDGSGESHFTVIVESPVFEGQSRVARQRMVNKALGRSEEHTSELQSLM